LRINITEFKKVLKKATINFSLETVQLHFDRDKIKCKMTSGSNNPIVMLDLPNTVLPELTREVYFNFSEPNQSLVPYLNLISEDEADIDLKEQKIVLKVGDQKSNIFFCSPEIVRVFPRDMARSDIQYFVEYPIDESFMEKYSNLKKIGPRFNKVYFTTESGELFMETTDKTNRYANSFRFSMVNDIEMSDISLCFDYKNIANIFISLDRYEGFVIKLTYASDRNLGMLHLSKGNSENYFLMSKVDIS